MIAFLQWRCSAEAFSTDFDHDPPTNPAGNDRAR
jgi:hypothetical protein